MQKSAIDTSRLVIRVHRTPGSHEQHFGFPVQTPDLVEIDISGQIRVNLDIDRSPCVGCEHFDGLSCSHDEYRDLISIRLMDIMDESQPILVPLEGFDEVAIRIVAVGFTEIEPGYALADVLDAQVVRA